MDEELVSKIYRKGISDELHRAELYRDKKAFIRRYFGEEPALSLRPVQFVPALSLLACLYLLIFFQQPVAQKETLEMSLGTPYTHQEMGGPPPEALDLERPAVEVKRLTSSVGPTVVYQKVYQDVPITVVWVLAP